jgi:hypothetical protein
MVDTSEAGFEDLAEHHEALARCRRSFKEG